MKLFSYKLLTFFYVLFAIIAPLQGSSDNDIENQLVSVEDRIYVSPEDLLITKSGIFLVSLGEAFPVTALYVDTQGIYIKKEDKIYDQCRNGHKIYHLACGGCDNWWCVFRCKCCSPW